MTRWILILARVGLVLLTLAGAVTIYQALFDIWMTAYPFANANEWRARLYIRLVTAFVIGLLWIGLVIWLWRQRKKTNHS
jgi:hypothetical protein